MAKLLHADLASCHAITAPCGDGVLSSGSVADSPDDEMPHDEKARSGAGLTGTPYALAKGRASASSLSARRTDARLA
jgi:hypothetical protein